jgi:hypothetical protein
VVLAGFTVLDTSGVISPEVVYQTKDDPFVQFPDKNVDSPEQIVEGLAFKPVGAFGFAFTVTVAWISELLQFADSHTP